MTGSVSPPSHDVKLKVTEEEEDAQGNLAGESPLRSWISGGSTGGRCPLAHRVPEV